MLFSSSIVEDVFLQLTRERVSLEIIMKLDMPFSFCLKKIFKIKLYKGEINLENDIGDYMFACCSNDDGDDDDDSNKKETPWKARAVFLQVWWNLSITTGVKKVSECKQHQDCINKEIIFPLKWPPWFPYPSVLVSLCSTPESLSCRRWVLGVLLLLSYFFSLSSYHNVLSGLSLHYSIWVH